MGVFKSPVERAEAELAVARRRITTFEAEHAVLAARNSDDLDFDTRFALGEDLALCDRKLAAARGDIEKLERNLTVEKEAEANAERDRQHKEGEKIARAGVRLAENVEAAASQLAAALAALEANRKQVDALNANRGLRPLIADGERRLRETPGRTIPAQFEEREVWLDAAGNQISPYLRSSYSEKVAPAAVRTERVQTSEEYVSPANMPTRYAAAITLVNRAGDRIWPPAR